MAATDDTGGIFLTRVEDLLNWGRKNSTWYLLFGTACCAIELMQTGGPRGDLERFGSAPRASPRQADLMIVAGTVTYKMASRIRTLYDQMAEPKYVLSMGSCSNCGGLFQLSYSVLKGHRPGGPRRRLRARLSAAARGADRGPHGDPEEDGRGARLAQASVDARDGRRSPKQTDSNKET